jgi:TPR repeat protein
MTGVSNSLIFLPPSSTTKPIEKPLIKKLPQEVLMMILSILAEREGGEKDLVSFSLGCREWKHLAEDNLLWRKCVERLCPLLSHQPFVMKEVLKTRWLADKKKDPESLRKVGFWLLGESENEGLEYLFEACRFADLEAMKHVRDLADDLGMSIEEAYEDNYTEEIFSEADDTVSTQTLDLFGAEACKQYKDLKRLISLLEKANRSEARWVKYSYELAKSLLLKTAPHPLFLYKLPDPGMYYLELAADLGDRDAKVVLGRSEEKFSDRRHFLTLFYQKLAKISEKYFPLAVRELEKKSRFYELGMIYYSAKGPYFNKISKEQADLIAYQYFIKGEAQMTSVTRERLAKARCQYALGMLCYEGRGCEQSYHRAETFWKKANIYERDWKETGFDEEALSQYKFILDDGFFTPFLKGYRGYKKSEIDLWCNMCFKLAEMYQHGLGVLKDEEQANQLREEGERRQSEGLSNRESLLSLFNELRERVHPECFSDSEEIDSLSQ